MAPSGKKKTTARWRNRKQGSSSSKTQQQQRKLSVEELLHAAENALTISDPNHAVTLYTAALQKAANLVATTTTTTPPGQQLEQQLDILEKRAEIYVSLQNQEAAMQDYQASLTLLKQQQQQQRGEHGSSAVDILERQAAIHMYIGQLTSENEALEAYQNGMDRLKSAMAILDSTTDLKQQQTTNKRAAAAAAAAVAVRDTSDSDILLNEETRASSIGSAPSRRSASGQLQHYKRQLARASCSIAELYLTDLCYDENAETLCETYLEDALKLSNNGVDDKDDSNNIDALQTMANLRLSQNRGDDAVAFIRRVFAVMQSGCQALASLVGLRESTTANNVGGATELLELQDVQNLPGFEFRCQTAKLLLECSNHLQQKENAAGDDFVRQKDCAQAAIDVLGSLLAENDEVVEVWTLLGDAFDALDDHEEDDHNSAKLHYWGRAMEMLTVVQQSLQEEQQNGSMSQEEEDDLQQQLDEVLGQIEDLQSKLEQARTDDNGNIDAMEE